MHLPDIHRLPTSGTRHKRASTSTAGFSASAPDHHGILHDAYTNDVILTLNSALGVSFPGRCYDDNHSFRHHFPRVSGLRHVR